MKKISILTTHRANNFGAILQAYALVEACRKLGSDAELLDWRCPHFESLYHKLWRKSTSYPRAVLNCAWRIFRESLVRKKFDLFRDQIPKSNPLKSYDDLCSVVKDYDVFIVGSDQVWNPLCTAPRVAPEKFDHAYLLEFVEGKKKCAYAASIGSDRVSPDNVAYIFHSAWRTFDEITMREYLGASYVAGIVGHDVDVVLDPVLLHDVDFWIKEIRNIKVEKDVSFLYNLSGSRDFSRFAEAESSAKGIKFVDVMIPALACGVLSKRRALGPKEFVANIYHARYVFTSSFHATAFSVLFGKKLYLQLPKQGVNLNSRIDTLMQQAKISGHKVYETGKEIVYFYDCSCCDIKALKRSREKSISRLKKMIV